MTDEKTRKADKDGPKRRDRPTGPAPGGSSGVGSGLQPGGTNPAGGKRGGFGSLGTGGDSTGPEDARTRPAGAGRDAKKHP